MHFEIYQQRGNALSAAASLFEQWRWRLCAANGEIIASGESYTSEAACRHAICLVMSTTAFTLIQIVHD